METANQDSILWQSFQQGNREAFAQIYNQNINELLSYGRRITTNKQQVKDSIQDLFLHLWTHKDHLSSTDSIRFYLFRSLRNRIVKNQNQNKDESWEQIIDIEYLRYEEPADYWLQGTHENLTSQRLNRAIEDLSPRQQEAIQLRFQHDFTLEEMATLMKLNNQSVRNLLHKSIKQLREIFKLAGWDIVSLTFFLKIFFL